MFKKILYAIIVIVIIVILAIMWKDSKNKEEVPPINEMNQTQVDTTANINKDIDSINIDGGIDADLQQIDSDIKTL